MANEIGWPEKAAEDAVVFISQCLRLTPDEVETIRKLTWIYQDYFSEGMDDKFEEILARKKRRQPRVLYAMKIYIQIQIALLQGDASEVKEAVKATVMFLKIN